MARVLGIGGVVIKSRNPDALRAWYREMLGVVVESAPSWPARRARTRCEPVFGRHEVLRAEHAGAMVNLRVDDADGLAAVLTAKGVEVLAERRQQSEDGVSWHVVDPDGTLLELWQPAAK